MRLFSVTRRRYALDTLLKIPKQNNKNMNRTRINIGSTMKKGEIPKRAAAARPSVQYYRGKLGESVLCSRKEFSQHMKFIKTVQQSWEKSFVQQQKQLLKDLMLLQLRGQIPEQVTVSDMKKWLIYRGRNTFRKMYQRFMKWSDPQCAELAWELTQRFQLDELEKEVLKELRLQNPQHNLEDLSRRCSSMACPVSPDEDMTHTDDDFTVMFCLESISSGISSMTGEVYGSSVFSSGSNLGSFSGGSEGPLSADSTTDRTEDIQSPTSRDSRSEVHLLNHSVTLMPGSQTEDCCYKGPDTQNLLRADTDHNIEEILSNLQSPPLSSPSSPTSVTEEERTSLTESSKSGSILCRPSSSCIDVISRDVVQSALETVISILEFEGFLGPQHRSEETDDSSSCQSSESDSTSERPRCVSVGLTGSQHDVGSRLIGGHNRKSSTTSLLSETELEACVSEITEAVLKSVVMEECHTPRPSPRPCSHAGSHLSAFKHLTKRTSEKFRMVETILRQLFVPQKVTDVTDASRAENFTDTLGASGESTTEMENTPVGSKPKKMKRVHTFFRQAWQGAKKTFCFRSNKISPDY